MVAQYQPLVTAGLRYFMVCVTTGDEETLRLLAEQVAPRLGRRAVGTGATAEKLWRDAASAAQQPRAVA